MNRFTIIVMTDSREDSDSIVQSVSALSADKEAEHEATIAQLASERDRMVSEAIAVERVALRRCIHSLKLGPVKIGPGESKIIKVESRFPFHAACLKVAAENVHQFYINDLSFVQAGDLEARDEARTANSNPVPAATFSDEGAVTLDLDVECRAARISVTNIGKKAHTFRAQIIGFRSEAAVPGNRRDFSVSHDAGPSGVGRPPEAAPPVGSFGRVTAQYPNYPGPGRGL